MPDITDSTSNQTDEKVKNWEQNLSPPLGDGGMVGYFNLNKRITKSLLGPPTTPFWRNARLRFFDFLVKMCLLKAF